MERITTMIAQPNEAYVRKPLVSLRLAEYTMTVVMNRLEALVNHCDEWGFAGQPVDDARNLLFGHADEQARFYGDEDGAE